MKYYVILTASFIDETADKKAIYDAKNEDEVLKLVYTYMAQYTNGSNVDTVNVIGKNSIGGIIKNEHWNRPSEAVG